MSRDINVAEVDINTALKGKPYNQYVDATDRSYLRIIRCRMMHSYSTRHEDREALHGYRSGLCVRVPAPSTYIKNYIPLNQLFDALDVIPDSDIWLITELVQRAILWCEYYYPSNKNAISKDIQYKLKGLIDATVAISSTTNTNTSATTMVTTNTSTTTNANNTLLSVNPSTDLTTTLLRAEDGANCKESVKNLLQFIDFSDFYIDNEDDDDDEDDEDDKEDGNGSANKKDNNTLKKKNITATPVSTNINAIEVNTLKTELEQRHEAACLDLSIEPASLLDLRQRHKAYMSLRYAAIEEELLVSYSIYMSSETKTSNNPGSATTEGGLAGGEGNEAGNETGNLNTNPQDPDESRGSGIDAELNTIDIQGNDIEIDNNRNSPDMMLGADSYRGTPLNVPSGDGVNDADNINKPRLNHSSSNPIKPFTYYTDDAELASTLSIAMQRCYIVIRDLMFHPSSDPFLYPVDKKIIPQYYTAIAQPISLIEIRRHLVLGGYENKIFQFYSDMNLLFDNAFLYNLDSTLTFKQAHKLLFVFERMFLETVLEWEEPLLVHDVCYVFNIFVFSAYDNLCSSKLWSL